MTKFTAAIQKPLVQTLGLLVFLFNSSKIGQSGERGVAVSLFSSTCLKNSKNFLCLKIAEIDTEGFQAVNIRN